MAKRPSVENEVQELRKDAERLARESAARDDAVQAAGDRSKSVEQTREQEDRSPLQAKVEGFVDTLQNDLRRTPALAAVGFFALGVIIGRLLRR